MRIGFACDSAYPWFNGGMEKRRYLIAQELVRLGHEVHLFTMYREGMPRDGDFAYKGVFYHCVGRAVPASKMYSNGRRNMTWPLKFALLLPVRISGYKFDLIDTDAFPFLHIPKLAAYAKLTGARFTVTWHEVWSKDYWKKYLPGLGMGGYMAQKLSALSSKRVIANTSQTSSDLISMLGFEKEDISVFPAAISKIKLSSFSKKHKRRVSGEFVAIGRLVPEKRIDLAIRAVAKTQSDLTIVGSGPEKGRLEALVEKLKMKKRVRFIEGISEEQLLLKLRNSLGLLMFSEREGMSIVTIEALALGTPVIITKQSSLPEQIRKYTYALNDLEFGLAKLVKKKDSIIYKPKIPVQKVQNEFGVERAGQIYSKFAKQAH